MPALNYHIVLLSHMIEILQLNDTASRKLILYNEAPLIQNENDVQLLCQLIETNTTTNYLSLVHPDINIFFPELIKSLEKNTTITSFFYDKEGVLEEQAKTIQSILERNRELALSREVQPENIDIPDFPMHGMTRIAAAHSAARLGDINMLYSLILQDPTILNSVDGFNSPLLNEAARCGQLDCVKVLLKLGADVNFSYIDCDGGSDGTALFVAVEEQQYVIAKLLLQKGADVLARKQGLPILHFVRDLEMTQLLVNNHADVMSTVVEDTYARKRHENSVLHSLVDGNCSAPQLIQFFIDKGVPVNSRNANDQTPLHTLHFNTQYSKNGYIAILNLFLSAGADPLLKDRFNSIPAEFEPNESPMRTVTKAYIRLRQKAYTLAQGQRDNDCKISSLPIEVLINILKRSTDDTILDKSAVDRIIRDNFQRPLPFDPFGARNMDDTILDKSAVDTIISDNFQRPLSFTPPKKHRSTEVQRLGVPVVPDSFEVGGYQLRRKRKTYQ